MDPAIFKHRIKLRVRNYEVDWQGIVHNANYLLYFETARIEYLKNLGVKVDINSIQHDSKVVLVRNEINYLSPVRFDDELEIFTRISYIKNTSFAFESFMEKSSNGQRMAENIAVHVWLNPKTDEPTRVSDEFRKAVLQFEGNSLTLFDKTSLA